MKPCVGRLHGHIPEDHGAPAPRSGVHGNGGVLSSQCTVIFGGASTV